MIYLASIPRCGSTWLFRSIAGLPQGGSTPKDAQEKYGIVKTHRVPTEDPRIDFVEGRDRAVFLFGDPIAAVASTRRNRWNAKHFANCGKTWDMRADILNEDVLGYERIFDAWTHPPFPVLCVRYEALEHARARAVVEDWLIAQRRFEFLPWQRRLTRPTDDEEWRIRKAYPWLIEKVRTSLSLFIAGI